MWYEYYICPKCKDSIREWVTEDFQEEKDPYFICPNCGEKMEAEFGGKNKADDREYKITLQKVKDTYGRFEKCVQIIMELGGIDQETAIKRLTEKNSVIFEGDLLHTYFALRKLDEIEYMIKYTTVPKFPYGRFFTMYCPDCGEACVDKRVEDAGRVVYGCFCEKCGDWLIKAFISGLALDETLYTLEASFEGVDEGVKKRILGDYQEVRDQKVEGDRIKFRDRASVIHSFLYYMNEEGLEFTVTPPYPYDVSLMKNDF